MLKPAGPEYIYNDAFTMGLKATDDSTGYVVPEFRVDGDGWYNYYGWPTDANAPFRFTAEGTEIDQLVYGKLGVPRVVPWDDVPSGYGRHQVEYRAIDASGNIGTPRRFAVTLLRPAPTCTTTITGVRNSPLVVASGVTCLQGATINGHVSVRAGASLVATDTKISGPVSADRGGRPAPAPQHGRRPGLTGRHDPERSTGRDYRQRPGFGHRRPNRRARNPGRQQDQRPAQLHLQHHRPGQPASLEPGLRSARRPVRGSLRTAT